MPLSSLDLNLLISLDALLSERSVTRAAERLGLSQPALSASLAKLRHHFGDPLLARQGNTYRLTPLALQLRPLAATALADVERVFESPPVFDPGASRREFSILVSDYALSVIGREVAEIVGTQAPGVRLRFAPNTPSSVDHAPETLRRVDALMVPQGFVFDLPYVDLFSDGWVCVVSAGNHRVGAELTLGDLSALPWVLSYNAQAAFTSAARQMQLLGVQAEVAVVVESFLAVPSLVAGSDRIALIQGRLAALFRHVDGLRFLPCPYAAVPIREALYWDPVHTPDPEHAWLRSVFVEAGRRVEADAHQPC